MNQSKPKNQQEPTSEQEPDPARSYERAKPEKESGMGRLDNDLRSPSQSPDQAMKAVGNSHPPRQIDSDDINGGAAQNTAVQRGKKNVDRSMADEEPLGEDLMPTDIHDPEAKRHPRKEGRGGTP